MASCLISPRSHHRNHAQLPFDDNFDQTLGKAGRVMIETMASVFDQAVRSSTTRSILGYRAVT